MSKMLARTESGSYDQGKKTDEVGRYERHRSRTPPRRYRSRSRSPLRYRRRSRSPPRRNYSRDRRPSYRGRQIDREPPVPSNVLGVFGLNLRTKESDLEELFKDYGTIKNVVLIYDSRSGRSRGYGFVTFEKLEDAERALEKTNGTDLLGRSIRVDFSKTLRPHSPTPGEYAGHRRNRSRDRYSPRRRSRSRSRGRRYSRSRSR